MLDLVRMSVRDALFKSLGIKVEINDNILHGNGEHITVCITAPATLNGLGWRLRLAPTASFDRWANSVVIEETFQTEADIIRYLENYDNILNIHKTLYKSLSEEYLEMLSLAEDRRFD